MIRSGTLGGGRRVFGCGEVESERRMSGVGGRGRRPLRGSRERGSGQAHDSEILLTAARGNEQAMLMPGLAALVVEGGNLSASIRGERGGEASLPVNLDQFAMLGAGGVQRGVFVGGGGELAEQQTREQQQRAGAGQFSVGPVLTR